MIQDNIVLDFNSELDYVFSHYKLVKPIGSGSSAIIFEALDLDNNQKVACKLIPKNSGQITSENVLTEASIIKNLQHNNIVKFIELMEDEDNFYMIQEFCEGQTLLEFINNKLENFENLKESEIKSIIAQILQAIAYLKQNNIAHRDLKPENIVISEHSGKLTIKLIDFGLATLNGNGYSEDFCGSIHYMAPEVLKGQKYTGCQADMWSVGVIFFILIADRLPFESENMTDLIQKIISADFVFPLSINEEAAHFVIKMLNPIATERMTALEALNHPYLKGVVAEIEESHENGLISNRYSLPSLYLYQKNHNTKQSINHEASSDPNNHMNRIRRNPNFHRNPMKKQSNKLMIGNRRKI